MEVNTREKTKITSAINWMEKNRPNLFSELAGSQFKDIIEADDELGERGEEDAPNAEALIAIRNSEIELLKRKAEFMLLTATEQEFDLQKAFIVASNRTSRVKNWNFFGLLATTIFSVSTLTALKIPDLVDAAQWAAAGGTLSSMTGLISTHIGKLSDNNAKLSATEARDRLIDLRYDLKEKQNELRLVLEYSPEKEKLQQSISSLNSICKEISEISGLLGILLNSYARSHVAV